MLGYGGFVFTLLALALSAGAVCPPDFLDTGQAQNGAVLSVKGSMDGRTVVLKDQGVPVLPYCTQASPVCTLECTVTFKTVHTPMYYINGGCFSAGGSTSVMELQEIGVNATHAHPNYLVMFPCHAIPKFTCYMNETVYTEVEVHPDASACIVPPQPTVATTDTTPPGSDGNSSTGNSTAGNSTTEIPTNGSTIPTTVPHHPFPVFTAGLIAGVFLIVFFTATAIIVAPILVLHRDRFRAQVCLFCWWWRRGRKRRRGGTGTSSLQSTPMPFCPVLNPPTCVVQIPETDDQSSVTETVPPGPSADSSEVGSSMPRDVGDGGEEMIPPLSVSATNQDGSMKLVTGR